MVRAAVWPQAGSMDKLLKDEKRQIRCRSRERSYRIAELRELLICETPVTQSHISRISFWMSL